MFAPPVLSAEFRSCARKTGLAAGREFHNDLKRPEIKKVEKILHSPGPRRLRRAQKNADTSSAGIVVRFVVSSPQITQITRITRILRKGTAVSECYAFIYTN